MRLRKGDGRTLSAGMREIQRTKEKLGEKGGDRENEDWNVIRTPNLIKYTMEYVATTKGTEISKYSMGNIERTEGAIHGGKNG